MEESGELTVMYICVRGISMFSLFLLFSDWIFDGSDGLFYQHCFTVTLTFEVKNKTVICVPVVAHFSVIVPGFNIC